MSLGAAAALLIFAVPYELSSEKDETKHREDLQVPYDVTQKLWRKLLEARKSSEVRRSMRNAKLLRISAEWQAWKPWILTG